MTTRSIQAHIDDGVSNRALWEIALQLSILNSSKSQPQISADEPNMTEEPYRAEPFRGQVIGALFKSQLPDARMSTMETQTVISEILRLKRIERKYQKMMSPIAD